MITFFSLLDISLPQDRSVRPQRSTLRPTWACVAAGRSRASARCTATPRAARWPQRETWWPGAAGCWSLSWRTPPSGNCTHITERSRISEVMLLMRVMTLCVCVCVCVCVCLFCRRQVNWREAKGEEEINIYQSERRRRTIHSLPKESRVSELTHRHTDTHRHTHTQTVVYKHYCSTEISLFFSHNPLIHDRDFLFLVELFFRFSTNPNIIRLCPPQVHLTSECVVDEVRRSQGNHGYQTRAAMEETSRQSAEAADDDESISEVDMIINTTAVFCQVVNNKKNSGIKNLFLLCSNDFEWRLQTLPTC